MSMIDEVNPYQGRPISPAAWAHIASRGTWVCPPHLEILNQKLVELALRGITRLCVSMPPRHGKSECISKFFPGWWLGMFPDDRILLGSYEAEFAGTWGRKARDVFHEFGPDVFGMQVNPEISAASSWDVMDWDGPRKGGMQTAGIGGAFSGKGAQLMIIDDPIKNAEEAGSEVRRDAIWDWFTAAAYTRLEPGAVIVILMTRWHEDDLVGRIQERVATGEIDEKWDFINLPALAEDDDPLGRTPGQALWPERFDEKRLATIRGTIGPHFFDALYQGRPRPRGGGFFKRDWFEKNQVTDAPRQLTSVCRYWDRAGSEGEGDWTVGSLVARSWDGTFYLIDIKRFRHSSAQRDQLIFETAAMDKERYPAVMVRGEQEPGSSGKEAAHAIVKRLAGHDAKWATVTGDKETRARPLAAQAEIGNVKMVRGAWNAAFLDEVISFPVGKYDDQVDATAGAFNMVTGQIESAWSDDPMANWRGERAVEY